MIDRHHLKIVRAIETHGTMTEAANALFLTQSALSHAMKKVEKISTFIAGILPL